MKRIIVLVLIISFLIPIFCLAASSSMGGILKDVAVKAGFSSDTEETTLVTSIAKFLRIFFSILGVIFLIIIVYGGFTWMTAGGNEEQINKSKKLLINAAIGLAIIILAYSITYFVTAALTYSTVPEYPY